MIFDTNQQKKHDDASDEMLVKVFHDIADYMGALTAELARRNILAILEVQSAESIVGDDTLRGIVQHEKYEATTMRRLYPTEVKK